MGSSKMTVSVMELERFLKDRENITQIAKKLIIGYTIVKGTQWILKARRIKKFCQNYVAFDAFKYMDEETNNIIKEKMKLLNGGVVNHYWPITPTYQILCITDPDLAHFLLNLSPEVQRKAGFSKELFGGDPNGFLHGLVFDEGKSWQA